MEKVSIIIPCHNEEKGIGKVLDSIPLDILKKQEYEVEILVIDNKSTDNTAEEVNRRKIKLLTEINQGKGYALLKGFTSVSSDTKYVVIIDGDNTYKPQEIIRLLEPLKNNFCDVIIGSRIGGKTVHGSLSFSHRLVNWIFAFFVRQFYKANITDCLSGYFAFKKDALDQLISHLDSKGFAIEMDMITKLKKMNMEIYSVPITYDKRLGTSKLQSVQDGFRILTTFLKNLTWSPK